MMEKILVSFLFVGSFLGGVAPTTIQAEDIIGDDTANIQVNGSLGLDNTDPEETIEEGDAGWINVSLDTATIFYNISGRTDIESPTYNITNNSGRPVDVSVANFVRTNTESITDITALNFTSDLDSTDQPLISSGTLVSFASPVKLFTLANNEGKLTSEGLTNFPTTTSFGFNGTVASNSAAKSNPTFTLTLQLDAITWAAS